ncbi:hypothetical protein [Mycolicibacterium mageritense]|uniref:hypothetical protein n=1 Tax=Mycolicibacterium mageritense TaxID=53462 RepID=UPI0034D97733
MPKEIAAAADGGPVVDAGPYRQKSVGTGHPVGQDGDRGDHLAGGGGGQHDRVPNRLDHLDPGPEGGVGEVGEPRRQPRGLPVPAGLGEHAIAGQIHERHRHLHRGEVNGGVVQHHRPRIN